MNQPLPSIAQRSKMAIVIPWTLVVVLAISNGATVLSERIHAVAFGAVSEILATVGPSIADAALARSPTRMREKAIDRATQTLKIQKEELAFRNKTLHAENESVKATTSALTKDRDMLRNVAARRAAAVRTLATRTTVKLAARTAEAVSSLPIRAAPYVGIAALVGFTSLEVRADCDIARSLAELSAEHDNEPIDVGQVCRVADKVPTAEQAWGSVKTQANSTLKAAYEAVESAAVRLGISTTQRSVTK